MIRCRWCNLNNFKYFKILLLIIKFILSNEKKEIF